MFADLLMPEAKKAKPRRTRLPWSMRSQLSPPPFGPIRTSKSQPLSEIEEEYDIIYPVDPWSNWTFAEFGMSVGARIISMIPGLKGKKKEPNAGKLIWLTGCGEASFTGAQGVSGPTDAARRALGKGLTRELGKSASTSRDALAS